MAKPLAGKTVIVTGAGRGIGEAVALALAREGMHVALLARSEEQLRVVASAIRRHRGKALAVLCDVADPAQIASALAEVRRCFGRVDALVNNAGVFLEAPITDIRLDDWERVLRVNATAPFVFCQQVLPLMREQGGGKIVNIASTAGIQGYLHQAAYCASKHALIGFSRCLAIEAKPHKVHVYTLCPGGVRTDFVAGTYLGQRLEGQTMLEPEDMADLVAFVLRQPENVDIAEVVVRRFHVE